MDGDDDEDVEEAGSDEGDVEEAMLAATEPQPDSAAPSYVSANLPSLQTAWETLFQLLVGYINVLQTQMQSKTSAATATANANAVKLAGKKKAGAAAAATSAQGEEPASLCIEACLGSVWALSRLCVDQLVSGPTPALGTTAAWLIGLQSAHTDCRQGRGQRAPRRTGGQSVWEHRCGLGCAVRRGSRGPCQPDPSLG